MYQLYLEKGDYVSIERFPLCYNPIEPFTIKQDYVMAYGHSEEFPDPVLKEVYQDFGNYEDRTLAGIINLVKMKKGEHVVHCVLIGPMEWNDEDVFNRAVEHYRLRREWVSYHKKNY